MPPSVAFRTLLSGTVVALCVLHMSGLFRFGCREECTHLVMPRLYTHGRLSLKHAHVASPCVNPSSGKCGMV
jgi:hypothetical protein